MLQRSKVGGGSLSPQRWTPPRRLFARFTLVVTWRSGLLPFRLPEAEDSARRVGNDGKRPRWRKCSLRNMLSQQDGAS
jgi:hypothetical protein